MWTTFLFACTPSTMNPLKTGGPNPFFSTIKFNFLHKIVEFPCPWITCNKSQPSWPYNRLGHKCDRTWSSILDTFHVIEHHPHILQTIIRLHLVDQIKSERNSIDGHLEQINLLPNLLTRKIIVLNIVVTK
jgi:hypothetical protein